MKNLETLIQELCPDGVEFVKLEEVCKISRGKVYSKKYLAEHIGEYPVYSSQTANDGILGRIGTYDCDGKFLTWTTDGAYAGTVFYRQGKFSVTNVCGLISCSNPFLSLKFLYYWLTIEAPKHVHQGMGNPKLMSNQMAKIEIPLPPIEVQTEIVRILDKFTSLEAELEAELDCRKRQYEYYRDKLLSFDNVGWQEVEWKKMSEVGTFIRGKRFVRTDIVEEGVPCIHYGDIYTYYGLTATKAKTYLKPEKAEKMKFASKNDVVIVGAGENNMDIGVGVAWLSDEKVAIHDACYIFKSKMNPRFVSHYLRGSNYHLQIKKYVCEGKICSISSKSIGRSLIPVPSLQEQERIATILDRFESLTTSLQSGLPAEIAARRQQYEYYRDKLLTFKRKGAV